MGELHPLFSDILAAHGAPVPRAATPPCRVCGKAEWVCCYDQEHPERAICIDCCGAGKSEHHDGETGHVWTYEPSERDRVCDHCGQFARNTDYYDHWDEP